MNTKRKPLANAFRIFLLSIFAIVLLGVLLLGLYFVITNQSNGKLVSSDEVRQYLLYVPENYNPSEPTPLIISIHGYADWPAHHSKMTGWNDLADENGFIVVYPSGTGFPKHWRMPSSAVQPSGSRKDVIFISDLIDTLEKEYNIDPARVFVDGLSNGGGMSYALGCELSARVAAVGGVAGAYIYPLENCAPTRPVPMIVFHGTADPIVPFLGGPSDSFDIPFPDIPQWVRSRAVLNNCSPVPVELPVSGEVSGIKYVGCAENAEVDFYTIAEGGHTWPGGVPLPEWIAGYTSTEISATRLIWEFYKQHPLPASTQ